MYGIYIDLCLPIYRYGCPGPTGGKSVNSVSQLCWHRICQGETVHVTGGSHAVCVLYRVSGTLAMPVTVLSQTLSLDITAHPVWYVYIII